MKKFLLAPFLAAVAMFVFGAAFWMSPLPYKALTPVGDNVAAQAALAKIFPSTGTYLIPGPEITDEKLITEMMQRGPIAEVHFVKEGHAPIDPGMFARGFVHYFLVSLLFAIFLGKLSASQRLGYACVVQMTTFIGVIGAVFICFSDPIWWHHPWGWKAFDAVYSVLACTVSGLVLGAFFKAPPVAAAAS